MNNSKRCPNFSKEEETLLLFLVNKYKNVIESKQTNAVTWKEKNKKWVDIEKEFNSTNGVNGYRPVKTLKEKYLNLKKRTKRKIVQNKLHQKQTGGGPPSQEILTDMDNVIIDIVADQAIGLPSIYDSDKDNSEAVYEMKDDLDDNDPTLDGSNENFTELLLEEKELKNEESVPQEKSHDWTTYSSKNLQQPISQKLTPGKPGSKTKAIFKKRSIVTKQYNSKNYQLIEKKLEFVTHQQKKFDEENELRVFIEFDKRLGNKK